MATMTVTLPKRSVESNDLFPEGIRVVSDGRHAEVYDIATGKQVRYVRTLDVKIDADCRPFMDVTLTISVPRFEYEGPVTGVTSEVWPPLAPMESD